MKTRILIGGRTALTAALLAAAVSCHREQEHPQAPPAPVTKQVRQAPSFNEDSAYRFVADQVAFGPRIPGTPAHAACAAWLTAKLQGYGLEVTVQHGVVTTYDGRKFDLSNIVAAYRPDLPNRILLCSHWDTRPFADRDSVDSDKPFDGANDGGSGTAVLLETARQLSLDNPALGVDIVLFDLEDYGESKGGRFDSWGLGAQYWSRNPHRPNYYARFGILLDMVGAEGAVFPREGYSMQYAPGIVDKVWGVAERHGYGRFFIDTPIHEIVDDHYFVNQLASIPCIDVIHYDVVAGDFMPCHHRHCDDLAHIDRVSLKAAGQVVLETLYHEWNAAP